MPKLKCPKCERILKIAEKYIGKRIQCPACKVALRVPALPEAAKSPKDVDPWDKPDEESDLGDSFDDDFEPAPRRLPNRRRSGARRARPKAGDSNRRKTGLPAPEEPKETPKPRLSPAVKFAVGGGVGIVGGGLILLLVWMMQPNNPKPADEGVAASDKAVADLAPPDVADTSDPVVPELDMVRIRQNLEKTAAMLISSSSRAKEWTGEWANGQHTGLSWRVYVLRRSKNAEDQALYKKFKLDEPWDSPNNKPLLDEMPDVYRFAESDGNKTRTQVVRGEGLAFGEGRAPSFRALHGNKQNTVLVALSSAEKAVPWTKPEDLTFPEGNLTETLGSSQFFELCMCDGRSLSLPLQCDPAVLKALFTMEREKDVFVDAFGFRAGHGLVPDLRLNVPPMSEEQLELRVATKLRTITEKLTLMQGWPIQDGLSWRVHMLPALGYGELYERFRIDEPWDSPHNQALLPYMPDLFRFDDAHTNVTAIKRGLTWTQDDEKRKKPGAKNRKSRIVDGTDQTLLFTVAGMPIPWTQPEEPILGGIDELGDLETAFGVMFTGRKILLSAATPTTYLAMQTPSSAEAVDASTVNRKAMQGQGNKPTETNNQVAYRTLTKLAEAHEYSLSSLPPPKHVAKYFDKNGVPHLSWRVHMLHALGYSPLYRKFHLNEPWDSSHNKPLLKEMPDIFRDANDGPDSTVTRLMRVIGEPTLFPDEPVDFEKNFTWLKFAPIAIVVGEDRAVPWTKPVDVEYDARQLRERLGKAEEGGFMALFENDIRLIKEDLPADTLARLFHRSPRDKRDLIGKLNVIAPIQEAPR